jgi:hypothetical protein
MEIIDKKEETLQLVLTEKGREKLSKSMFKPHSYAFYDNEIIYDNSYNNKSEEQNLIQPRIKKTLILGEKVTWDDTKKEINDEKSSLKYPEFFELGGYEFTKQYKPAWKIYVKEGKITGSVEHVPIELIKQSSVTKINSIDDYRHDKIPQLNVYCDYKVFQITTKDRIKKTYVARSSNDIKLEIYEENSFDDKENFIADVYQFSIGYFDLKKLIFADKEEPITKDNVENFFNVYVDNEIEVEIDYSEELETIKSALPKDPKEC